MGSYHSRLKHSSSSRITNSVPSIKLPTSSSFKEVPSSSSPVDICRSRSGSTSSTNGIRHPISIKNRRLIQSCFSNPHEGIGKRSSKRVCESKSEFSSFYLSMDQYSRDLFDENIKTLLNKVVANIDYVDEIERLSEQFGSSLVELRSKGFRPDFLPSLADSVCKECLHLDSAVHKAHTTTEAFSQLGTLLFSSVRNGFYMEIRKKRRTSNSFSSGSNCSRREKKNSESGKDDSPRSYSPDSHYSDEYLSKEEDNGLLRPPSTLLLSSRSF